MVSHERADRDALLILRQSLGRVIDRFVKAVAGQASFSLKQAKICHCCVRVKDGRQDRGIRSDYQVLD